MKPRAESPEPLPGPERGDEGLMREHLSGLFWTIVLVSMVLGIVAVRVHSDFRRSEFLKACMADGAPADFCAKVWSGVR